MSADSKTRPWPQDLLFDRAKRALLVTFDNGERYELPFELLRVESPSAEERGHGPEKRVVGGKRSVGVSGAEPVGRYAVRIAFDDGHASGLFSWDFLRDLGRTKDARQRDYLERLSAAGLSRD